MEIVKIITVILTRFFLMLNRWPKAGILQMTFLVLRNPKTQSLLITIKFGKEMNHQINQNSNPEILKSRSQFQKFGTGIPVPTPGCESQLETMVSQLRKCVG